MDKVTDDMYKPNGLCFSPDYKKLYICDTGSTHYPDAPKNIKVYDVADARDAAQRQAVRQHGTAGQGRRHGRRHPRRRAGQHLGRARAGSAPGTTASTFSRRTARASA